MLFDWKPEPNRNLDGEIIAQPYNVPRALTSSAQRISRKDKKELERFTLSRKRSTWQSDAWDFYDLASELKFSSNYIANTISRMSLYTAFTDDSSRIPTKLQHLPEDHEAYEYVEMAEAIIHLLESTDGGISDLMRLAALNLFIAGEFFLIKIEANPFRGIKEHYEIRSTDEIVIEGQGDNMKMYLRSTPDEKKDLWVELPDNAYVSRMWRKHPRFTRDADSSVRGVLNDLDDLILYTREARSVSLSRIPAGIFFIPDSLIDASRAATDDPESEDPVDEPDIADMITEAFTGPIADETNIHNSAPLVLSGPADAGKDIRFISSERAADPMHSQSVDDKRERVLAGLDIPSDVAKGMGDMKYSSGAIVQETLFKAHIEPLTLLIVDALTNGFLRPALINNGVPEHIANQMTIWYDPSQITAKPSKEESSNYGIEKNLISDSTWRSIHGYTEGDAPDEEQIARVLLLQKLVLDPQLANSLLDQVFPKLTGAARTASQTGTTDAPSANQLNEALGITPDEQVDMIPQSSDGFQAGEDYISTDPEAEIEAQQSQTQGVNLIEPDQR